MASIITPQHRPQMASVRPNVFSVPEREDEKELVVIHHDANAALATRRIKIAETVMKEVALKDVSDAEIVICGGYGLGKENFSLIHEMAIKVGAAVGATRKVVDEGWAPYDAQIGQTGKTVAPDLYIACGVSGALQHSIGIKNAKRIIAVNNDPSAAIFSLADVAILGDAAQVLAELNKLLIHEKGA
jgi:electron transfer flavoprotein alpha subunit